MTDAEKLVEAEDALHKLTTGQAVRMFVDQNGERIEFTMTNVGRLRSYVAELKNSIAGVVPVTGAVGFFF